jgi:hypothetical protein
METKDKCWANNCGSCPCFVLPVSYADNNRFVGMVLIADNR